MMAVVPVAAHPCLGKQMRIFGLFLPRASREVKISRKCRSHVGPIHQVSEGFAVSPGERRLCEAKPEAKSPWLCQP